MHSSSSLLRQAWNTLFYSKNALLSMIALSILPTILILTGLGLVMGGAWLSGYFGVPLPTFSELPTALIAGGGIVGIALFVAFLLFTLVCSYLAMRIVANNAQKKHEPWKKLLSHWRKSIDFFGLGLSLFFYTVGWVLVGSLGFLLVFIHQAFIIPAALFVIGLTLYKVIPLVMTSGVFFFENISGFQAIKQSQLLVQGRFWKTTGYIGILVLLSLGVVLVIGMSEFIFGFVTQNNPQPGPILISLFSILTGIGLVLQTLVQMLLKFYYSSYLFALYKAYKK